MTAAETTAPACELAVPALSLVALVGVSGSGKSTFAARNFLPTEVISSDFCRGLVADDDNDQAATGDAFDVLYYIAGKRLAAGRLTVIDATNVQPDARKELVALAREHDVLPVAVVMDIPERICAERNAARADRTFGPHVLRRQRDLLRRGLRGLRREGFRTVHVLKTPEEVDAATITRTRLYNDLRHETGPFDVIGDVHGCRAELEALLADLGYVLEYDAQRRAVGARHPQRRRAVFVGDLVDRGPDTPGALRLVMGMAAAGDACPAGEVGAGDQRGFTVNDDDLGVQGCSGWPAGGGPVQPGCSQLWKGSGGGSVRGVVRVPFGEQRDLDSAVRGFGERSVEAGRDVGVRALEAGSPQYVSQPGYTSPTISTAAAACRCS